MNIHIANDAEQLGKRAAEQAASVIADCIRNKGKARIVLSTGQSQFEFLQEFSKQPVDWSKVEMFHLDEYVGLPESHPASFRKYLKERFLQHAPVGRAVLVNGEGDLNAQLRYLNEEIGKEPIDLALIGIGENAHIAFNDPPADFEVESPYIVVHLDEGCKRQQVGEGWFPSVNDVPDQAISMSVRQIMKSRAIISCVPHQVKAAAIAKVVEQEVTNLVPGTILRTHPDWSLYLDEASASQLKDRSTAQA